MGHSDMKHLVLAKDTSTLRATTNLVVPKDVELKGKDLKSGFLYVYNKGYTGNEVAFMNRLWMSVIFPEIADDPSFGKSTKGIREFLKENLTQAGFMKLKKVSGNDPHFEISVPLAEFNRYDIVNVAEKYKEWFTDGKSKVQSEGAAKLHSELNTQATAQTLMQKTYQAKDVINAIGNLDARGRAELTTCFRGIRLLYKGSLLVVFADFVISPAIAQQLTTTEWMQIRNIDLYPLILQWAAASFVAKKTPLASFPVSKIARTLPTPQPGQARIDKYGLSVDHKGIPMWLPEKVDNTTRYEDLYSQVGAQPDGSFTLIDIDAAAQMIMSGGDIKPKLPANIPILIDWINYKYAFTLSTGFMKVLDLSRNKAVTAAHAVNLMNTQFDVAILTQIVHMATSSGVEDKVKFKADELTVIATDDASVADKLSDRNGIAVMEYWRTVTPFFKAHHKDEILFGDINPFTPILAPLVRYCVQAQSAILGNLDAVNTKYAVSSVSLTLGWLTLIAKYCVNRITVETEANTQNAAAINQSVQKGWEPPSIPLLSPKIGFLPHQKKCRNLLKDSPEFAILPVQAGGGKTVLALTDILYEIKANRSEPYLILCPGHLVAQYVKEIVFFTSGKLNVIAINSYTIYRNKYARLTKMIAEAPRNTVVVANYDCLRNQPQQVCYGTGPVTIYPVIEFLRQFGFGYAMLDESHSVKNEGSQRTQAALKLIADIPKKRLASGTMAHDSPSDLASQIAMLDPTLFGSKEAFNARFGLEVSGDRVIKWKPGAQEAIMRMIQTRVVVAKAMRKEWAALLPSADEEIFGVELTPNQMSVYQAILTESLQQMKEDAKTNKTLAKFFAKSGMKTEQPQPGGNEGLDEDADEEAEDAADESAGEDLESMLSFYLARLEQFITAPTRDPLGAHLSGEDARSPKVNKIIERIKLHLDQKLTGKVLVFTNYTDSAEEIFDALPPEIKKQALLYVAAEKIETGATFEKDPRYTVMVGVENSMNTGLNLQFVSRLIRTETVWNPGTLEQGNSRVNRPELKKADRREKIYYDWIVANNTLDITKVSRLMSKVIAVAKFENAENPAYQAIEDVPIIPMNADAIQAMNSWHLNLKEYMEAYASYKQVQHDDYKEYRESHAEMMDASGNVKLEIIPVAPTPKDVGLMKEVPYTPGLEIYGADELGLVRIDDYLRQDATAMEGKDDEEEETAEGALTPKQKRLQEDIAKLIGQPIHTEFGEGVVKSVMTSARLVNVALDTGMLVRVSMSSAFIITRKTTSTEDIRTQLLKITGDMPITKEVGIQTPIMRPDSAALRRIEKQKELDKAAKEKKAKQNKAALSVELEFSVSNGFLGISYFVDDENSDASNALQALGFRPTPPFVMAKLRNAAQLAKQFNMWKEAGFSLDPLAVKMGVVEAFTDLSTLLKSGKLGTGAADFRFSTKNQLTNFFRQEVKPSLSKNLIKPYPLIEDDAAYIVMHLRGQPATLKAIKVKPPALIWKHSEASLVFYGLDTNHISAKIKEVLTSGIQIANIEDLKTEFKRLKKMKFRKPKETEMDI